MNTFEDAAEALASRVPGVGPAATNGTGPDGAGPMVGGTAADAGQEFAKRLGVKRREAGAPIRNWFVANDDPDVRPPLARLLSAGPTGGGGRGGQLRVKLYISLLWICAAAPYETVRPGRAWAGLLGLDDPENNGARRVQAAMRDLQARKMVTTRDRGGWATAVTPLIEHGTGKPYSSPSDKHNQLRQQGASNEQLAGHRYFRLPSAVWTNGLLSRLSGPGLAMLLVLRCEQQNQDGKPVWFSPERAVNRFGLAESTRRQGLAELRQLGLVTTVSRRLSESGDYIDVYRRRKVHTLTLTAETTAGIATAPPPGRRPTVNEFMAGQG